MRSVRSIFSLTRGSIAVINIFGPFQTLNLGKQKLSKINGYYSCQSVPSFKDQTPRKYNYVCPLSIAAIRLLSFTATK